MSWAVVRWITAGRKKKEEEKGEGSNSHFFLLRFLLFRRKCLATEEEERKEAISGLEKAEATNSQELALLIRMFQSPRWNFFRFTLSMLQN